MGLHPPEEGIPYTMQALERATYSSHRDKLMEALLKELSQAVVSQRYAMEKLTRRIEQLEGPNPKKRFSGEWGYRPQDPV